MVEITVPTALQAIASGGKALSALATFSKKAKGDQRALLLELRDNLTCLDLVANDGVELMTITDQLSTTEYERLCKEGFDFNRLKRGKIADLTSLRGTDLSSWRRKTTAELVDSIYAKIREMKIRYPHVADNPKYRWPTRVNNIRKRIWLLLVHLNANR